MQKFQYNSHGKPEKLIDFLTRRFQYHNRLQWEEQILSGRITINQKLVHPDFLLSDRSIIFYDRPQSEEPPVDQSYQIIFEDQFLVAVEKNGTIPVSESGKYHYNTLINCLKEKENYPELFTVHRLDRETSGIVLIAKNKLIAQQMGELFLHKQPQKIYHAVLKGEMQHIEQYVDQPIGKNPQKSLVSIRQIITPTGKASKTLFCVEKKAQGLTLAKIQIFTGRTHQIRCHAEFIGHPILGDKLYGQSDDRFLKLMKAEEKPIFGEFGQIKRQLLHASYLSFKHPVTHQEINLNSDYKAPLSVNQKLYDFLKKS